MIRLSAVVFLLVWRFYHSGFLDDLYIQYRIVEYQITNETMSDVIGVHRQGQEKKCTIEKK